MSERKWWAEIRSRIEQRAAQLNRSVRSILSEAKVAGDVIYRDRGNAPKLDTLERIAKVVGWNLPQILGFAMGQIPREVVHAALRAVRNASRNTPYNEEQFVDMVTRVLNTLMQDYYDGLEIDERTIRTIERMLAQDLAASEAIKPPKPKAPEETT